MPWLIAALAASDSSYAKSPIIVTAAGEVSGSSPGYLTVRYYALRLMIAAGQSVQRSSGSDSLLKNTDIPLAAHNLLNEERLKITSSLEDFLQHAPETPVPAEVDINTGEEVFRRLHRRLSERTLFNRYAAELLVKRLPLAVLIQAAESQALPKHLRREIARSAWVTFDSGR